MDGTHHIHESVEEAMYELIAASLLDAIPEERLPEFDAALAQGEDAVELFLQDAVPHVDQILLTLCTQLSLPEGTCST